MLYHEAAGLRKGLIGLVLLFNVLWKESSLYPAQIDCRVVRDAIHSVPMPLYSSLRLQKLVLR